MSNEQKFWRKIIEATNPEWQLQFPTGDAVDGVSEYDVFVYLMDTSTGWLAAAGLKSLEFTKLAKTVANSARTNRKIVGAFSEGLRIALRGDPQPAINSPQSHEALTAASAILTMTKTYEVAIQQTGGVAGHWLYLVYRLQDGKQIGRPAYIGRNARGFMPQTDLEFTIHKLVAVDTDPRSPASVARDIRAGKGAVLCDAFSAFRTSGVAT